MPPKKTPPPLPEEFLAAEFEYIANSAFQANEDRSKAASFFLVAVGSLVAAIFGAQLNEDLKQLLIVYRSLAGLFFVLTILGGLTILQLVRLRIAWRDAALAMNQIKDFVAEHHKKISLENAFRWKTNSLPPLYKRTSISFYSAIEVALLSALTFGAFVYFSMLSVNYTCGLWPISVSAGIVAFFVLFIIYKLALLNEEKK